MSQSVTYQSSVVLWWSNRTWYRCTIRWRFKQKYNNGTGALWGLELPAALFFFKTTTKKISKFRITGLLWGESIHRSQVKSLHKGQIMRTAFPLSDLPTEFYSYWHDDVIKSWKHFPRYWPFVRGILRSPVNSPHKGQWRGALMFSLICAWINGWVNNREAGDLRCHRAHHDVTIIIQLNELTLSEVWL